MGFPARLRTLKRQTKDIFLLHILSDPGIHHRVLFPVRPLQSPGAQPISQLCLLLPHRKPTSTNRNFTQRFLIPYKIPPCSTWKKITVGSWLTPNTAFISSQPQKGYYCKIYFMHKLDLSRRQVRCFPSPCPSRSLTGAPLRGHTADKAPHASREPWLLPIAQQPWKWSGRETSFYFCLPFLFFFFPYLVWGTSSSDILKPKNFQNCFLWSTVQCRR